jgi:thymidylate synthase
MRFFVSASADLAWQEALSELIASPDYVHDGRNGSANEILPCVLNITDPRQRWILSRYPPYNPASGLVEFIWIIAGKNESNVVNFWNPALPGYAGDGDIYHGAYGYRLRHEFGIDQIRRAYSALSQSPETRQVVLQIWKPDIDMPTEAGDPVSRDIPCNILSLLKVRDGYLHWTQVMRSNDIMRGLPYNIIQFTLLHEVMASWLDCKLGEYFHLTDSLHLYEHDRATYGCIPTPIKSASENKCVLSLSCDETLERIVKFYDCLVVVAKGELSSRELHQVFCRQKLIDRVKSGFLADLMVVIGSDAARRYGFKNMAYEFAESCTDLNLQQAATAWLQYLER